MLERLKQRARRPGFTLAELVVAIFIVGLLSTAVVARFRGSGQQDVDMSFEKITNDIRLAQTNGLGGRTYGICYDQVLPSGPVVPVGLCDQGSGCGDCRVEYPQGDYGFMLSSCQAACSYILFADVNADRVIDAQEILSGFPQSTTNGNVIIASICSFHVASGSVGVTAPLPPFDASGNCQNGWQAATFAAATFSGEGTALYSTNNPLQGDEELKYLAVLLKNKKTNQTRYFYLSRESGLIGQGSP